MNKYGSLIEHQKGVNAVQSLDSMQTLCPSGSQRVKGKCLLVLKHQ